MAEPKGVSFNDERDARRSTHVANVNVRALIKDLIRANKHERLMFATLLNDLRVELDATHDAS